MFDGYLFIILLSLTIATVAGILVQLLFSLLEVKKRRLQERLGSTTGPADDSYESLYGPIALEQPGDLSGLLGKSEAVQAFNTKLMRAYPGVVLQRFLFMIVAFAVAAAVLAYIGTQSIVAAVFGGAVAGMLPFVIVSSRCAKRQKTIEDQLPEALDFLARVLRAGHGLATGLQMVAV